MSKVLVDRQLSEKHVSEVEGYACDRNGMLIPARCRNSNGDECMCWPKIAQPAEAQVERRKP